MKPDEVQEIESSVTEDIQLSEEAHFDTAVSAEDMFNENVNDNYEEINKESPTETYSDGTSEKPPVEENNSDETMTNEYIGEENYNSETAEEPLVEQSYSEETAQEPNTDEASPLQTQENENNNSDDGSIQPRVLRDDDGGEKIKFRR